MTNYIRSEQHRGLSEKRCNWSDTPSCVLGGKDLQ
jgi:hypothetical protein